MVVIELTKNKKTIVDDNFAHLSNWKWCTSKQGYAKRGFFKEEDGVCSQMFLHHAVIGYPLNGLQVDHINGDPLDNRLKNLRFVTNRQNGQNQKCHRLGKKSSRYCGVYWNKANKNWGVATRIGHKKIWVGTFDNEDSASQAYLRACEHISYLGDCEEMDEQIRAIIKGYADPIEWIV